MSDTKTKQCSHCKSEIDATAKKCPKCMTDLRNFFLRHPVWSIIGVLVLLSIIGSASGTKSTTSIANNSNTPAVQNEQEVSMKVTANELYEAYSANEVAGDAKYKGKLVEVSGTVDTIGKDALSFPYITFHVGGQYSLSRVQCVFPKTDEAQLAEVVKGKNMIIVGRVMGMTLGNIIIQESSLKK